MAEDRASFAVDIPVDDSGLISAAAELEKYNAKLREGSAFLKELQAQKRLLGKDTTATDEMGKLNSAIQVQQAQLATATREIRKRGGAVLDAFKKPEATKAPEAKSAEKIGTSMFGAVFSATMLAGAVRDVGSALQDAGRSAVQAGADLIHFGIATADSAQQARIELEKMLLMPSMFRAPVANAEQYAGAMDRMISSVASRLPATRASIAATASELYRMGLSGRQIQQILPAATMIGGAQKFMAMGYSAQFAGKGLKGIADTIEKRFGGVTKREMLLLSTQTAKLQENFTNLFRNVDISPLTSALSKVTDNLSESTFTGYSLKKTVEELFGLLFGSGAPSGTGNAIRDTMDEVINAILRAELAAYDFRDALSKEWNASGLKGIVTFENAITVLGVTLGIAGAFLSAFANQFEAIVTAARIAANEVQRLSDGLRAIGIIPTEHKTLGANFATGMALGIEDQIPAVMRAAGRMAEAAEKEAADKLKVHSPSLVMRAQGLNVGEGFALGIGDSIPRIGLAAGRMGEAVPRAANAGGGGGTTTIHHGGHTITVNVMASAGMNAHDLGREVADALATELEQANVENGAKVAA